MTIRNVTQAKEQLSALLVLVENGEEIMIARGNRVIAKLVPVKKSPAKRKFGLLKGQIEVLGDIVGPDQEVDRLFFGGTDDSA